MRRIFLVVCVSYLSASFASLASAQVVRLSLKEAETRAVDTHPQIRAGHYNALAPVKSPGK